METVNDFKSMKTQFFLTAVVLFLFFSFKITYYNKFKKRFEQEAVLTRLGCTTNFIELCACVRTDFLHRGFSPVNKNGKKLKGFSR
jgi:hypothetical protein